MYSVDRFEDDFAVCISDDEVSISIPLSELPEGITEGSIIEKSDNGYIINEDETKKRKDRIKRLQDSLWQ